MNIDSKEFKEKHKNLFNKGYCKRCIAIMTSPLSMNKLCKKCDKIFIEEIKKYI